jgi:hypothetical protein
VLDGAACQATVAAAGPPTANAAKPSGMATASTTATASSPTIPVRRPAFRRRVGTDAALSALPAQVTVTSGSR